MNIRIKALRLCCLAPLFLTGTPFSMHGQHDTVALGTVVVSDHPEPLAASGIYQYTIDSATQSEFAGGSLDRLLEAQNISVRSYGLAGSATVSMRGTAARHTSIQWNGFDINSPTLGLADVRLIPVGFADRLALVYGPTSSFASPAIGGSLLLDYRPGYRQGISAGLLAETGSFGHLRIMPAIEMAGGRVSSSTRLLYEHSRNNFPFANLALPGSPEEKQEHARHRHTGINQYFHVRLRNNMAFTAGLWYQVMDREIPAILTVPESGAEQQDSILRMFLSMEKIFRRSSLTVRAAWFDERQHFEDSIYGIDAQYNIRSYHLHALYRHAWTSRLSIRSGLYLSHHDPRVAEYAAATTDERISAFAEGKFMVGNLVLRGTLQQAWRREASSPVAPSAGLEWKPGSGRLTLFASGGRFHSFPSMNDLYWIPGGDAGLLPESAWAGQAGYRAETGNGFEWVQTGFAKLITNWIQWRPSPAGYYAAFNLSEVFARGVEHMFRYRLQKGKTRFTIESRYSFTLSTRTGNHESAGLKGKQLVYMPRHSASAALQVARGPVTGRVSVQHTGRRFTTDDHTASLDPYTLAGATLRLRFTRGSLLYEPYISVGNLGDAAYQVIPNRPEPGIYYRAGILIKYRQIKTP